MSDSTQMALIIPDINVSDYMQDNDYKIKIQGMLRDNIENILAVTVKIKYKLDLVMSLQQP